MVQGEACRTQDYDECEAWVKLELTNLHDASEAQALASFGKADERKYLRSGWRGALLCFASWLFLLFFSSLRYDTSYGHLEPFES